MIKLNKIALILATSLILTSCGEKKHFDEPELKEPVGINESFVPVQRGDVGDATLDYAIVEPVSYCHFWTTMVNIDKVHVSVGDYVKEGDLLAEADVDYLNEEIAAYQRRINCLALINEQNNNIYEMNKRLWEYKLQGAQALGDAENEKACKLKLEELDENIYFTNLLYNHQVGDLNSRIAEKNEVLGDSGLYAKHDGYVTFAKSLSGDNTVTKDMNVVVISDYEDTYLRMTTPANPNVPKPKYIYANVGGVRKDLEEIEYSANELLVSNSKGIRLYRRFKYADGSPLPPIGDSVPIIQKKKSAADVLYVNNESLYEDENGTFVYVRTNGKNEKRYIETGIKDKNVCEVVSGIDEGEPVYYKSKTTMPEKYTIAEAKSMDFASTITVKGRQIIKTDVSVSTFEGHGTVKSIASEKYEAKANDIICEIETNMGAAALLEESTGISNRREAHDEAVDSINEQIKAAREELEKYRNALSEAVEPVAANVLYDEKATDSDAEEIPDEDRPELPGNPDNPNRPDPGMSDEQKKEMDPYIVQELECQVELLKMSLEIENINFNYDIGEMERSYSKHIEDNDGNGTIIYRAKEDGVVDSKFCEVGQVLDGRSKIFSYGVPCKPKTQAFYYDDISVAGFNQEVTFEYEGTDGKYTGKIIGILNPSYFYITDVDGYVYITSNSLEDKGSVFVDMSDDFYNNTYDPKRLKITSKAIKSDSAVCVPSDSVYSEKNGSETLNYVWKQVGDALVKQYVQLGEKEDNYTAIVTGIKAGDKVLMERTNVVVE